MVRVSGFVILVGLLFLIESERSSGLPTKLKANDFRDSGLSDKDRENIRRCLMNAAKELQDADIIKVLKTSLILRLKICFSSPLPTPPPLGEVLPEKQYEAKRDEAETPEQPNTLRKILKAALVRIDEEEVLEFLKASLYFRLKFCLHAPFLNGYFPGEGPSAEPSQEATVTPNPAPTTPEERMTLATTPEEPMAIPSPTPPEEPMPSTSSPATETKPKTVNDSPDLPDEALEDALASISRRNEIPFPPGDPRVELTRDDPEVPIDEYRPQEKMVELEEPLEPEEESLLESFSDNDDFTSLSESILDKKESAVIEESDGGDDRLIDSASDGVGKADVRAETKAAEIMTANSDVGEFDSVIRIDYNALEDDEEQETGTGGVDLGPIIEPNELLSL